MGVLVRYVREKQGRLEYRRVVPEALQAHFPEARRNFIRPLGKGTFSDPKIAGRYASAAKEWDALVEIAIMRRDNQYSAISSKLLEYFGELVRYEWLKGDEDHRTDTGNEDQLFGLVKGDITAKDIKVVSCDDSDRRWRKTEETLAEGSGWDETDQSLYQYYQACYAKGIISDIVADEVDRMCNDLQLMPDKKSAAYRKLHICFLENALDAMDIIRERQKGKRIPTPPEPADTSSEELEADEKSIREIAELWHNREKSGASTVQAVDTALRLLEGHLGHIPMNRLTAQRVSHWVDLLVKKPALPKKEHRHLPLGTLVALYEEQPGVQRITGKTVNTHLGHLRAVWNWARKRGYVSRDLHNPFEEQSVKEAAPLVSGGFSKEQLTAIFGLPVFTKGERPVRGRGEASFWVPLLLLQYGLRPEEACQLLTKDIEYDQDERLWKLRITDIGDHPVKGKRSLKAEKNINAQRRALPITENLIRMGFIDYAAALRKSDETALFPRLTISNQRGHLHSKFSEWWGEYTRAHGALPKVGVRPLRDFRPTWTTAAAAAGLSEEEREWIQGHYMTKALTSNRRYGTRNFGHRISDIVFDGVNLERLHKDEAWERSETIALTW